MANQSAKNRIEKAHLAIMRHPTFCAWSGLLFIGGYSIDKKVRTAGVNGSGHVKYGEAFIDSLTSSGGVDKEVNYVVLHENGHKALCHWNRWKPFLKKDKATAMEAVDQVVNNMIEDLDPEHKFAEMPKLNGQNIGHFDRKYAGKSLREVFDMIMASGGTKQPKPMDDHDFDEFEEGDKDGTGEMTQEEVDAALEHEINEALRSGSYLAGKMGGTHSRTLSEILDPKVDWRDVMREFAMDACSGDEEASWVRPHRRFVGVDMYMPTSISTAIGELGAFIDTSGSVGQKEMTACISELVEIARTVHPSGIRLFYWGDDIVREEYYTPDQYDDIVRVTKPVGGGGTSGGPAIAARATELGTLQCAVILTDGGLFGGWGEWTIPTLWAITTRTISPVGKTVHFEVDYT